jgi:hypothetical protein
MDRRDQGFGVLHREGIDAWPIVLSESCAAQIPCRVVPLRMIAVPELEGAPDDADRVVVRLLAPALTVRDLDERRVTHLMKELFPERRAPHSVQHPSIRHQGCRRQIVLCEARPTVR